MKKDNKAQNKNSKRAYQENTSLDDLGLEPPKIYRKSQEKITRQNSERAVNDGKSRKNSKENITRAEKRQKENKKRKQRNKLRRILAWFIIALIIAVVGVVLSLTVFFKIGDIQVVGNKIYKSQEIVSQCNITTGENLFLADTEGSKALLERNLPYIYNAEIKRKFPYTIVINIKEATPAYSIKNSKTYILLDDNFKVLEDGAKKSKGIIITNAKVKSHIPGQEIQFSDENTSKCLEAIAKEIKENRFEEITHIYSKSLIDNYVIYDNRITFKLGNCDNLENKFYQGYAACEKLNETSPNVEGELNITGDKRIYFTEN